MEDTKVISLLWRLFIPNATVLMVAGVVLAVQPANGRVVSLGAGVLVMLGVNVVLMRRAFAPLQRLTDLMAAADPLRPGHRIEVRDPGTEVTVLAEAFNAMLARLEGERRASLVRTLVGREDERRHLAAELHDDIGQTLTALMLQQSRLADQLPASQRAEALDVRQGLLTAIEDVRGIASRLRPEALDALGLRAALADLCDRLSERTGLRMERALDADLPRLGPDVELAIYRVAQEAATNAMRHAPGSCIRVALRTEGDAVVLEVSDDGEGFDRDAITERGLRGMRERAVLIGAHLDVAATPGRGTCIRLRMPAGTAPE
ncbi:MAG: HAMP domain-containing protein [Solirubrobacterales bacterium]|nr:HAMP domain-containing protein [Solirubrobacterales bacterium]